MTKGAWTAVIMMGMAAMIGCIQEPLKGKPASTHRHHEAKQDQKISIDKVPAAAKKTILAEAGKNKIEEIEKETEDGKVFYEAAWEVDGKDVEIKVAPDGKLVEKEFEISMDQVPGPVKKTILKEAGKARILDVEKVLSGAEIFFEAKWLDDNKKIEVKVAPDGKLLGKEVEDDDDDKDEKEVEVTIDQVPAAVKKTILKEAGKNKIEEIEKETKKGKVTFEAEWTEDEMEVEIKIAPDWQAPES